MAILKQLYFDTHVSHNNEGSFLKTIENGEMKLSKLSTEQTRMELQTEFLLLLDLLKQVNN